MLVPLQERFQRAKIRGQAAQDLVLLQLVGHGDLNRAVKRQLALVDPPQDLDGQLHDVVAGQHVAAELGTGLFDLPRQGHFFTPRKQRDLAHLRQIHAHRVVGPGLVLVHAFQQAVDIDVQVEFVQLDDEVGHVPNQIVVRIFESRYGVIGQIVDHFIRARSCVVIQVVQQCVVQLQFSSIKQSRTKLSPNLTLCHKSRPKATKFYHCFPMMIPQRDIWQGIPFTKKIGVPGKVSNSPEIIQLLWFQPARRTDPVENRAALVRTIRV